MMNSLILLLSFVFSEPGIAQNRHDIKYLVAAPHSVQAYLEEGSGGLLREKRVMIQVKGQQEPILFCWALKRGAMVETLNNLNDRLEEAKDLGVFVVIPYASECRHLEFAEIALPGE